MQSDIKINYVKNHSLLCIFFSKPEHIDILNGKESLKCISSVYK